MSISGTVPVTLRFLTNALYAVMYACSSVSGTAGVGTRRTAAEVADDREHAAVRVPVEGQAELFEDRADVGLHGLLREPEHREVVRSSTPSA